MALSDLANLVSAVAWPVVVLLGIIILRKPLAALFTDIGKRATKLSLFNFAVELSTLPELQPSWKLPGGDVRQLTRADVFDSATMTLFQELSRAEGSDYIVVDLGTGREWLTSRLYVFALLLKRMQGLRSVVFTAKRGESGVFIGVADAGSVRWSIAMVCPWMEVAFAQAYAAVMPPAEHFIVSNDGALDPWRANDLVREFLMRIQVPAPIPAAGQPGVVLQRPEWIELGTPPPGQPQTWEHASWLTESDLLRILGPVLERDSMLTEDPSQKAEERARAIARRTGDHVPLVTPSGQFQGLIDRRALLETIARSYADQG